MINCIVSAPGKVILHGEHAVVYGKTALAASLDLRTYLTLNNVESDDIIIHLPDVDVERIWKIKDITEAFGEMTEDIDPLKPEAPSDVWMERIKAFAEIDSDTADTKSLAIVSLLYLYLKITKRKSQFFPVEISVLSQLPAGAGLGSSASYSVCLSASLLIASGAISPGADLQWSESELDLINKWAFIGETVIHGRPSGIDNSTSTYGGALTFTGGNISRLERMAKIEILLTNTKVPRSTKVLVAGVRKRFNEYPDVIKPVIESIEALVNKCVPILEEMNKPDLDKCYAQLEELVEMNHNLLCVLGVSHPSLENVRRITSHHGFHSKLTGAGGGGCAVTLNRPDQDGEKLQAVIKALEDEGYKCWTTSVGGPGIQQHSIDDRKIVIRTTC
ncbi:mevalonate kinase-like [Lineus longissimus]|uniref:mevalonate kinase-like n=1 Tax=Lineus longissimus TaxID=88925 RepID=UPI00315D7C2C